MDSGENRSDQAGILYATALPLALLHVAIIPALELTYNGRPALGSVAI